MLKGANNVYSVLLNDASKLTSALPAAGTVITDANLEAGAIVLCDVGMRRLNAAAYTALGDNAGVIIVQGKGVGQQLMKSPVLTKGNLTLSASGFKAAKQQVTCVGFNGTTGSLPVASNSTFFIKIRKRDNDAANRSQPEDLFAGPVKTDASGNQLELATLLMKSGIKNFANQPLPNKYLKFEMLSDAAGAAPTGTTTVFGATNGSKVVTIDGTLTNVAIGDYIRLEGAATTNAIYKVTAYTASTSITLDTVYTGVTGSYAIANVRRITSALAIASNCGVELTGTVNPFDVNKFRNYYANRFLVSFSDTSTLVSTLQGTIDGNGVWQQVAMDEYMSYGFEGQNDMLGTPPRYRDQVVKIPGVGSATALTSKYCALNFEWTEDIRGLVTTAGAKGSVLVYINLTNDAGLGKISTPTTTTGNELITAFGGITAFGVSALTVLDEA